ncbi:DUF6226 family protein [Microbacterium sp.]|jgi:hypothetical protein|uniref:DUF6226 family protein n=1 Tax=Microbacterium sp. TaxID=51671 RepID=UPI0039C95FCD
MSVYVRPWEVPRLFVGALGRPIPDGQRWGVDGPPDDSYSVTSNLERFSLLHDVADALIVWLQETYDATVGETPEAVADLLRAPTDAVRAARVRRRRRRAFGGLRAGALNCPCRSGGSFPAARPAVRLERSTIPSSDWPPRGPSGVRIACERRGHRAPEWVTVRCR